MKFQLIKCRIDIRTTHRHCTVCWKCFDSHSYNSLLASSSHRSMAATNARQWFLQVCQEYSNCCGRFCPCQRPCAKIIIWKIKDTSAKTSALLPLKKLNSIWKIDPHVDGRRECNLIKIPGKTYSGSTRKTFLCVINRKQANPSPGVGVRVRNSDRRVKRCALLAKLLLAETWHRVVDYDDDDGDCNWMLG